MNLFREAEGFKSVCIAGMSKNEAKEELGDFTVEFRQIYDS